MWNAYEVIENCNFYIETIELKWMQNCYGAATEIAVCSIKL